jgi:RimJ/RimL family protein N-acetyltransferase
MIEFAPLRREDMPELLKWRNASPGAWRDPIPTTITKQYEWFDTIVSHNLWFGGMYCNCIGEPIKKTCIEYAFLMAQTQLYPIDKDNHCAEIGLIVDPERRCQGIGEEVVKSTIDYGFRNLGLNMIWGECYYCTDAWKFWDKICPNRVLLPQRKFWEGKFWDSLYFWWLRDEWKEGK